MPVTIAHFCGQRLEFDPAPGSADRFGALQRSISETIAGVQLEAVCGSLAAGGEILVAEAALAEGAALHVVLPFGPRRFKAEVIDPAGADWAARFDHAIRCSASIEVLPGDPLPAAAAWEMAYRRAMDRALTRARLRRAEAIQIAVWDRDPNRDDGRIQAQIDIWAKGGLPLLVVAPDDKPIA